MFNSKLKVIQDKKDAKSDAQIQNDALKEKDRIIREQELEIAKLKREAKYKTSPAQRRANKKWRDAHKEEHKAMMREYMRKRRAAAKENHP